VSKKPKPSAAKKRDKKKEKPENPFEAMDRHYKAMAEDVAAKKAANKMLLAKEAEYQETIESLEIQFVLQKDSLRHIQEERELLRVELAKAYKEAGKGKQEWAEALGWREELEREKTENYQLRTEVTKLKREAPWMGVQQIKDHITVLNRDVNKVALACMTAVEAMKKCDDRDTDPMREYPYHQTHIQAIERIMRKGQPLAD
jgi:SMC interacting uncharacterized protein involved in chromosome segregation